MKKINILLLCICMAACLLGGCGEKKKEPTLAEKTFSMSWEENEDLSVKDFRDMLDEAGVLYSGYNGNDYRKGVVTTTTDSFLGYDCVYGFGEFDHEIGYSGAAGACQYAPVFYVAFESEEDFKEGRKKIEESLEKQQVKDYKVLKGTNDTVYEGARFYTYVLECTQEEETKYKTYKFVDVMFYHIGDDARDEQLLSMFPGDKTYTDSICMMQVYFARLTEEEYIRRAALGCQYDAIAKKYIDMEELGYGGDDENELYIYSKDKPSGLAAYFMQEYDFDIEEARYIENRFDKKMWYINHYFWDDEKDTYIDLSGYGNLTDVYCAKEYNYNVHENRKFADDAERAVYIAENCNYNLDEMCRFPNGDAMDDYLYNNYFYDMYRGSYLTESEIVQHQAVKAYQDYLDSMQYYGSCYLIYVDDDDIPELYVDSEHVVSGCMFLTYCDGAVNACGLEYGGFDYIERQNLILFSNGRMGYYGDSVCRITDGKLVMVASGDYCTYEADAYYRWNDVKMTGEEYNAKLNAAFPMEQATHKNYDQRAYSVQEAYEMLTGEVTAQYRTNEYLVNTFEMSDGWLTVRTESTFYNSASNNKDSINTICFPVSPRCEWHIMSGSGDNLKTYEELKEEIDKVYGYYAAGDDMYYQYYGMSVTVVVKRGMVVMAYISGI